MLPKIISVSAVLSLIILSAPYVYPQSGVAHDFSELEQTAQAELKENSAAGAAIAIVKGDKIIFQKGIGVANSETGIPVTPETLFQIGSVTKTFTAAAILGLAAEGKLKLDSPIGRYASGLSRKLSKVTLSQLLSHTAGILDEPDEFGMQDESLMAPYILSWKDDYSLFEPGEVFSYSNSGFALAGFVAQKIYGKPYTNLMTEKVFGPLKMSRTTFHPTLAMTYPLALGHIAKDGASPILVRPLPNDARLYPAGTMYTSLADLSRFAVAFLNEGMLEGTQIISPRVIKEMSVARAKQLGTKDRASYGYGLNINDFRGVRCWWHEGAMTGYMAFMLFAPEERVAIIVLSNTNGVSLDKTQKKAMEMMLPLKPEEKPPIRTFLPMTEVELQRYVGIYDQPKRFKIEIYRKNGKLFIKEFGQDLQLNKVDENRFVVQFPRSENPVEIFIKLGTDGKPRWVSQYVWAFRRVK